MADCRGRSKTRIASRYNPNDPKTWTKAKLRGKLQELGIWTRANYSITDLVQLYRRKTVSRVRSVTGHALPPKQTTVTTESVAKVNSSIGQRSKHLVSGEDGAHGTPEHSELSAVLLSNKDACSFLSAVDTITTEDTLQQHNTGKRKSTVSRTSTVTSTTHTPSSYIGKKRVAGKKARYTDSSEQGLRTVRISQKVYTAVIGEQVKLECVISPTPWMTAVSWQRISPTGKIKPLNIDKTKYTGSTPNDPHLGIGDINKDDEGEYECTVSNLYGGKQRARTKLKVTGGPPLLNMNLIEHINTEGEAAILKCYIHAKPPASAITWFKKEQGSEREIKIDDYRYFGGNVESPALVIENPEKPIDEGRYICEADNIAGSGSNSVVLKLNSKSANTGRSEDAATPNQDTSESNIEAIKTRHLEMMYELSKHIYPKSDSWTNFRQNLTVYLDREDLEYENIYKYVEKLMDNEIISFGDYEKLRQIVFEINRRASRIIEKAESDINAMKNGETLKTRLENRQIVLKYESGMPLVLKTSPRVVLPKEILKDDVSAMDDDISLMKKDIGAIKEDINTIKQGYAVIRQIGSVVKTVSSTEENTNSNIIDDVRPMDVSAVKMELSADTLHDSRDEAGPMDISAVNVDVTSVKEGASTLKIEFGADTHLDSRDEVSPIDVSAVKVDVTSVEEGASTVKMELDVDTLPDNRDEQNGNPTVPSNPKFKDELVVTDLMWDSSSTPEHVSQSNPGNEFLTAPVLVQGPKPEDVIQPASKDEFLTEPELLQDSEPGDVIQPASKDEFLTEPELLQESEPGDVIQPASKDEYLTEPELLQESEPGDVIQPASKDEFLIEPELLQESEPGDVIQPASKDEFLTEPELLQESEPGDVIQPASKDEFLTEPELLQDSEPGDVIQPASKDEYLTEPELLQESEPGDVIQPASKDEYLTEPELLQESEPGDAIQPASKDEFLTEPELLQESEPGDVIQPASKDEFLTEPELLQESEPGDVIQPASKDEFLTEPELLQDSEPGDVIQPASKDNFKTESVTGSKEKEDTHRLLAQKYKLTENCVVSVKDAANQQELIIIYDQSCNTERKLTEFGHDVMIRNQYRVSTEGTIVSSICTSKQYFIKPEDKNILKQVLNHHKKRLFACHSNLNIITTSPVKSKNKGADIIECPCIVLVCSSKGYIPKGESKFPEELIFEDQSFVVDVREGYFQHTPYSYVTFNSSETHQNIKMGCSFGIEGTGNAGTIGPFVDFRDRHYFLTCAHIVNGIHPNGYDLIDLQNVYAEQPHAMTFRSPQNQGPATPRFGEVRRAVYLPNNSPSGVDVAVVEITEQSRLPTRGEFAIDSVDNLQEAGFNDLPRFESGDIHDNPDTLDTDMRTVKFGAKTHATRGVIRSVGTCTRPLRTAFVQEGQHELCWMNNQIEVYSLKGHSVFLLPGDSGAGVFVVKKSPTGEQKLTCIGLVIGSTSYGSAVVTPIAAVLDKLGLPRQLKQFPESMQV